MSSVFFFFSYQYYIDYPSIFLGTRYCLKQQILISVDNQTLMLLGYRSNLIWYLIKDILVPSRTDYYEQNSSTTQPDIYKNVPLSFIIIDFYQFQLSSSAPAVHMNSNWIILGSDKLILDNQCTFNSVTTPFIFILFLIWKQKCDYFRLLLSTTDQTNFWLSRFHSFTSKLMVPVARYLLIYSNLHQWLMMNILSLKDFQQPHRV